MAAAEAPAHRLAGSQTSSDAAAPAARAQHCLGCCHFPSHLAARASSPSRCSSTAPFLISALSCLLLTVGATVLAVPCTDALAPAVSVERSLFCGRGLYRARQGSSARAIPAAIRRAPSLSSHQAGDEAGTRGAAPPSRASSPVLESSSSNSSIDEAPRCIGIHVLMCGAVTTFERCENPSRSRAAEGERARARPLDFCALELDASVSPGVHVLVAFRGRPPLKAACSHPNTVRTLVVHFRRKGARYVRNNEHTDRSIICPVLSESTYSPSELSSCSLADESSLSAVLVRRQPRPQLHADPQPSQPRECATQQRATQQLAAKQHRAYIVSRCL